MSNLTGTIFGVYIYNGYRVFCVKMDNGQEVYLNDDLRPVVVLDEDDLQTITVRIDGELKSPWIY